MLIKAYIHKHMFHLPMQEDELLHQVEEALNKKVAKASIAKLNPLTKIEENENILIEKQRTNIFLLNYLLLVLNHKEKEITEPAYYDDELILSRLGEETGVDVKALPFEEIVEVVSSYLHPSPDGLQDEPPSEIEDSKEKIKDTSFLENVQFSVEWLKGAQKELNRRES